VEDEWLDTREPWDEITWTEFRRNARGVRQRLHDAGRAAMLMVDGEPALVVQSAEAYQRLLDELERAEVRLGIRVGREDARNGDTLSLDAAFGEIRKRVRRPCTSATPRLRVRISDAWRREERGVCTVFAASPAPVAADGTGVAC